MLKIKRWLILLAYSVLIVLALVGMGVAGVPVPPPQNKKEEKVIEINVEMLDEEQSEANSTEILNKN